MTQFTVAYGVCCYLILNVKKSITVWFYFFSLLKSEKNEAYLFFNLKLKKMEQFEISR